MSDSDEDVVYKDTADSADYKNKKKYRYEMLIYVIVVILAVVWFQGILPKERLLRVNQ